MSIRTPIAVAGADQAVNATGPLTTVSLDGSDSFDPDGNAIEFEWSVPAGSGAMLSDPNSAALIGQFPVGPTLFRFVGVVSLRAERDGTQRSRTYSIVTTVSDGSGNFSTARCVVVVSHDRKK